MQILWHKEAVVIHRAGYYRWPKGMIHNPSWTRWVYNHQLRLCVGGAGRLLLPKGWKPLKRGSCQWLRAGWEYQIESKPTRPLEFLTIRFELRDTSGERRHNSAGLPPVWLPNIDTDYLEVEMQRIINDVTPSRAEGPVHHRSGDTFSAMRRLRATARLLGLLMEIDELNTASSSPAAAPAHPRVLKIQELAHRLAQWRGQQPTVEELAREAEYTRSSFCRAFKEIIGTSPQAFMIGARLNRAQELLQESSLSIKAIAAELGYQSSDFFIRQFHARLGCSPGEFRRGNSQL